MNYKFIQKTYLLGWLIASIVWYLIRTSNIETGDYLNIQRILFFISSWLSQGFLYGILFYFITHYITKRVKFYQMIGIALFTQLSIALLIIALFYPVVKRFNHETIPNEFWLFMTSPTVVFGTLFSLIVNAFISLTMSVNLILGQNVLKNILTGKYYTPLKEKRIFMFLDMQDSTAIAEKLGHLSFSMLLQDCFYELSVFNKYNGEIYKYVGDEAILTWPVKRSINTINCIHSFFEFTDILNKKSSHFKDKYDVIPSFKAGVHVGYVTVTEIGRTKREIAYLGDTVNTAARIQDECKRLESNLLLSEDLLGILVLKSEYEISERGSFVLRGKAKPIKIYSVELAIQN